MEAEKFIDSIRPLARQIQAGCQIQYEWAKEEVHSIVNKGYGGDLNRLGRVLDVLSDTALFGIGEDLFRHFLAYVYAVDAEMADFYAKSYLETTSENIDEKEE